MRKPLPRNDPLPHPIVVDELIMTLGIFPERPRRPHLDIDEQAVRPLRKTLPRVKPAAHVDRDILKENSDVRLVVTTRREPVAHGQSTRPNSKKFAAPTTSTKMRIGRMAAMDGSGDGRAPV